MLIGYARVSKADGSQSLDLQHDDLRAAGFAERILAAIDCVTRREEESYDEFVTRSQSNPLARLVKLADLEDNMDLKRIGMLTDDDVARLNRYHRAWRRLQTTDNDKS